MRSRPSSLPADASKCWISRQRRTRKPSNLAQIRYRRGLGRLARRPAAAGRRARIARRPRARADRAPRATRQPASRARRRLRPRLAHRGARRLRPMTGWLVSHADRPSRDRIFLILGLGYLLGKIALGGFKLGAVTGTLLAGVLVGQLGITLPNDGQAVLLSAVPVRDRLPHGTAVLPRLAQRRVDARGSRRDRRHRRARRGLCRFAAASATTRARRPGSSPAL